MLEWIDAQVAESLVLRISASPQGLREIRFHPEPPEGDPSHRNPLLSEALSQLQAYFAGRLREFNLPLDLAGTVFQIGVWRHLQTIPYGETRSYSAIAQAIGRPSAVRAV